MGKRVTITDLARITGFSKTTISHVVNETPGARIRPETRELILKAAREHNYVPNFFARNIIRGRTRFLGFLTYSLPEACRSGELIGAEEACRESDCYMIIFNAAQHEDGESNLIEDLVQRGIEGLYAGALDSPRVAQERLGQFDIELALGQKADEAVQADCVFHEVEHGFHQVCDALAYHGHSRVGFVAPDRGERDPHREIARRVFHERQLAFEEFAVDSPKALHDLPWLHHEDAMTAIVCFRDQIALSLMATLASAGRRVPEDVSLVLVDSMRAKGVDTLELSQLQWRSYERGRTAMQRLIHRLYDESEASPPYARQALEPLFYEGVTLGAARERVSA